MMISRSVKIVAMAMGASEEEARSTMTGFMLAAQYPELAAIALKQWHDKEDYAGELEDFAITAKYMYDFIERILTLDEPIYPGRDLSSLLYGMQGQADYPRPSPRNDGERFEGSPGEGREGAQREGHGAEDTDRTLDPNRGRHDLTP